MPSDNPKRRSLLFPFRSHKEPPKFEVVNRKKSPLVKQQLNPTASISTGSTTPVTRAPAKPVNTSTTTSTSTSNRHSLLLPTPKDKPENLHTSSKPARRSFDFTASTSNNGNKPTKETITNADIPSNLSVLGSVPPVPEYNTNFIVPDAIQNRSFSTASRKGPPRRKPPPSLYSSQDSLQKSEVSPNVSATSLDRTGSNTPNNYNEAAAGIDEILDLERKSLVGSVNNQSGHENSSSIPINEPEGSFIDKNDNKDIDDFKTLDINTQIIDKEASKDSLNTPSFSETPKSYIPQFPTPQIHVNEYQEPEESTSMDPSTIEPHNITIEKPYSGRLTEKPKFDEPTAESTPKIVALTKELTPEATPKLTEVFKFPQSSDNLPSIDNDFIEEMKAPITLTNTTESRLSYASSSEFFDADDKMNTSHDTFKSNEQLTNNDNSILRESEPESDAASSSSSASLIVKPLQFHKKSLSADTSYLYSSPTTNQNPEIKHEKKISLSEEILRDIENFRPGIGTYQHEHQYEDNVSPVTPLNFNTIQDSPKGLLDDEFEDSEPDELNLEEVRPLKSHRDEEEAEDRHIDQGSLFNDSSDEEINANQNLEKMAVNDYQINDNILSAHSSGSSVKPEINYEPESSRIETDSDEGESVQLSFQEDLPRSLSNNDLYGEIPLSEQSSFHNEASLSISDQFRNDRFSSGADSGSQYSFNPPPQHGRALHIVNMSEEDEDEDRDSIRKDDEDASNNYGYAEQAARRTFHVVNDGNYSDSDSDANSFDRMQDDDHLNTDYIIHQEDLAKRSSSGISGDSGLSFTARSPIHDVFSFDQTHAQYEHTSQPAPTFNLETASIITPPNLKPTNISSQDSSPPYSSQPSNSTTDSPLNKPLLNNYDRRDETVAPVQYLDQYGGTSKSRRLPPSDTPAATRVGRSASITASAIIDYTSIKEENERKYTTIPAKSSYVETLRFGAATTNSVVSSQTWRLPIGISEIDPRTKKSIPSKSSSVATHKRPTTARPTKVDLKHGKIKPRLLASEVDEDDESEIKITEKRDSSELERFKTLGSSTSFSGLSSPTVNSLNGSSPRKEPPLPSFPLIPVNYGSSSSTTTTSSIGRSGTLMSDYKVPVTVELGRSGTLLNKSQANTLFIANPDIDSD